MPTCAGEGKSLFSLLNPKLISSRDTPRQTPPGTLFYHLFGCHLVVVQSFSHERPFATLGTSA